MTKNNSAGQLKASSDFSNTVGVAVLKTCQESQEIQSYMVFGVAVKAARKDRGWLGQRAGVFRPTIARIEQGKDGHTTMLYKVATALELSVLVPN